MSEASGGKHKPGPWRWVYAPDHGYQTRRPQLLAADGSEVCNFGDDESYCQSAGVAPEPPDAALIEAAPDLLAALRSIEWSLRGRFVICPCCGQQEGQGHAANCQLAASIAKATGGIPR